MSDLTEIKSESERRYYEQLYPYKLDKLDELGEKAKATDPLQYSCLEYSVSMDRGAW